MAFNHEMAFSGRLFSGKEKFKKKLLFKLQWALNSNKKVSSFIDLWNFFKSNILHSLLWQKTIIACSENFPFLSKSSSSSVALTTNLWWIKCASKYNCSSYYKGKKTFRLFLIFMLFFRLIAMLTKKIEREGVECMQIVILWWLRVNWSNVIKNRFKFSN